MPHRAHVEGGKQVRSRQGSEARTCRGSEMPIEGSGNPLQDKINITPATEEEREWAARLMAGSEPWITLGREIEACRIACGPRPEYELFIAHEQGRPCGFILCHPLGLAGSAYIASIAVADDFRGRGIGARLLHFAEDRYRSVSRHIFLCVSSFNTRARQLYERHGYVAVGEFKDYVIEGASEILMHKRLSNS